MAGVLSLIWGALFLRRSLAIVAALAVFSHFLADWPVHNADLALYPYAATHLGYGLYGAGSAPDRVLRSRGTPRRSARRRREAMKKIILHIAIAACALAARLLSATLRRHFTS